MPKVSVIIPVYNVERYLARCLDSVINQTFTNIEIICIDDASTDGSLHILDEYAEKECRLKILRNIKNLGLGRVRNIGINMARGEYILFVDSDDWIAPLTLENLYDICHDNAIDIGYFDFACVYENATVEKSVSKLDGKRKGSYDDIYNGIYFFDMTFKQKDDIIGLSVCALYRTKYLRENKIYFTQDFIHEDLFFSFKAVALAKRVRHFPVVCYFYYRNQYSITGKQPSTKNFLGVFVAYAYLVEFVIQQNFDTRYLACIDSYVNGVYRTMDKYFLLVKNIDELAIIQTLPCSYQLLFKTYMQSKGHYYLSNIFSEAIENIRRYSYIIVYGAGRVGYDTVNVLQQYGISKILLVETANTSCSKQIRGVKVQNIYDLNCPKDESIVLLAATSKHKREMREVLDELGYHVIVEMTDQ